MLNIQERVPTTIQNPNLDEKILFNDATDGKLKTKDSSGVVEELSTDLTGVPTGGATGEVLAKASATDGDVEWVDPIGGVKEYVALLSQNGENAPVATVLKNTLGGTVVWTYASVGNYNATLIGAFIENKVFLPKGLIRGVIGDEFYFTMIRQSDDVVSLLVQTELMVELDGFGNIPIKIEVYP